MELTGSSQIKFIHEYFEQLSVEADSNLLDSNFHKPSQLEIAKNLAKNCEIFRPRRGKGEWEWLHEASKCFHVHLRNASFYHQFQENLKVLTNEVEGVKESCSRLKEDNDVFRTSEKTRNLLEKLLELQSEVERMQQTSRRVVPIHLRRLPCQQHRPLSIVSIGSYYDVDDKIVEENSEHYLLDNSDARRWKVMNNKSQELFAPSLLFILPCPDAGLMQEAYKLRWHLVSVWKFCVEEAKRNLKTLLTTQLDKGRTFELQQLASIHKKKILETLNAAKDLLSNGNRRTADDVHELNDKMQKLEDSLANQHHNSAGIRSNSPLSREWGGHHSLTENIKEMEVYMKTFSGNVASQVCSQNHLVGRDEDRNNKPQFKSCAYIKRWSECKANPSQKLMMIYEVGSSPGFTSDLRGEVERVVEERVSEQTEETQFTSQTIKETQRFFIRGVFDPRTGRNISNQRAIDSGIIDLKKGLYRNPVSGEDVSIAEAMNRGLIEVEYSNKSVEMGELIKSGIFKTWSKKEIVSYVILNIRDPKTGRNVSVADALGSGLIDREQGRFILDKESGDAISIETAIEKGLLEVKELNRHPIVKEEPSNVKVVGVYDIVGKHFIQLQQALRRDVMDKNTAALRNKATGEVIPLKEAVRRGLVLLEISPGNDSNSLKNFPVLKQEDFDEIMESVADGYSADPIVELMSEVSDDSLFYDPSNNEQMSLKRAMISSRVGFNPLIVTLQDGTKCSLHDALLRGILDLKGVDELLKVTGGKRSLLKLVEDERLHLKTGDYVDLATKQRKSLEDAVQDKQLNPGLLFYWDDQSHVVTSLKASLDNGRLKNGQVFDFKGNDWLTMEEAVGRGLIDLEVNSDQLMEKYCNLMLFKDLINEDGNDAVMIKGQPLADAIMHGKLDVGGLQISSGGEGFVSLPKAIQKGLIDPNAARRIADVAQKNDLNNFFVSHKTFDPSTSRMEHPTTGRKITFLQAVDHGVINPNSVFMVDCMDDGVKSMKRLAAEGKFNLENGKFKDANTGRERSMLDAIKNGLVKSSVDPDSYLEQSSTIESVLKKEPRNQYIELKNGDRMKLEDAIAAGFVDPTTKLRKDGATGKLVFDDETDGDVLICLKEVSSLGRLLDRFQNDLRALKDSRNPDLNEFESFKNRLGAFKADVDKVFGSFDEVDSSAAKNFDKLKTATDNLQNNFQKLEDDLDAEINKRTHIERRTSQGLEKLMGLRESIDDLEDEFRALERRACDPNMDLDSTIRLARDLDAKLQPKMEELLDAESYCDDLMEFLRNSEVDNRGIYTNNVNVSRIDRTLKDLTYSLDKINDNVRPFISDVSTASQNHKDFSELEELFLDKLGSTENEIASLNNLDSMAPGERSVVLRELSDLESALVELESLRNDLERLGKEVDSSFKKLGRVSNCRVMRADDLEQMRREVSSLQNQINRSVSDDESKKNRLLRMREDVSDLERTSAADRLSLDRKKLLQLSDSVQKRRRIIEVLRHELSDAISSAPQNAAAAGDDDDLMERLQQIDDKLQNKQDKITALSDLLKQFNDTKESLNSWMKGFATRVNKKDDSRILRIKIPKLSEEMSSKDVDLKRLDTIGGELMTPNEVADRIVVRDDLLEVNTKWDDTTNMLAHFVVVGASSEMEKLLNYLDETENKMRSMDAININRDQLINQLKSHQKFHSDLLSKKSMAGDMVKEYSRWLSRFLGGDGDEVKMKLDALTERMNALSQSSMSRLICLEDAVTLATHFDQSLSDLKLWISEMEADVTSMETNVNNNTQQGNKLQEHVKAKNHEINDHFELMEILKGTGLELKELCDEKGAAFIDSQVSRLSERYDRIRDGNRKCLQSLQEAVYNSNDEAYNLLNSMNDDVHFYERILFLNFRPSLSQPVLLQQMTDLQAMHDDTLKIAHVVRQVQQELTADNSIEEMQLLENLLEKEKDLESKVAKKKADLENILRLVEEFEDKYAGIMSSLQTIQDTLSSQDYPGIETSVVSDQINELNMMEGDLHNVRDAFKTCDELVDAISDVCDESIVVELRKLLNNRDHIFGNVLEGLSVRRLDLEAASDLSQKYGQHLENVATWLPIVESRLSKIMKAKSAVRSLDPTDVDEQLCNLKKELMLSHEDLVRLKDVLSSFKVISPLSTEVLSFEVNDIETRFQNLLSTINSNFNTQHVDQLGLLQDLIDRISSERFNAKEHAWNAKLLKSELNQLSGDYFNNNPPDVVLSQQLLVACKGCHERATNLKDKELVAENLFKWFEDFKNDLIFLRALRSQGAPLKEQAEHFEKRNREFEEKMKESEKVLNEIKSMEGGLEVDYLLSLLQENISNSAAISEETEQRLKEHAEDVNVFHSLMSEHSREMNDIETLLAQQPMKALPNDLERDLLSEKRRLEDVTRHGSNLKFFGRKQDSVAINSALLNAELRWNRLFRRLDDIKTKSSADENQKEKFVQQYNDLTRAFEEIERKVNDKNLLKDLMILEDEISASEKKLHALNHTLRNMKTAPGGGDNDLHSMVQDLKKRWNKVHNSLISKKNKLDLDLISSGKVAEAIKVQCNWLRKCLEYLDENQPLLGDLDTVSMLIDQYRNFQEDLQMHESLIESIRSSNPPQSSVEELNNLWKDVSRLNEVRKEKLHEAHGLASEFQEAVEKVRRILPEIEEGLKESGMNIQTEEQLLSLIDHHQKLYSKLCEEQPIMERIVFMSDEILENCHPSATRFMQYYLTITQKRWEQALMKSNNLLEKLNESLKKFRGGATVVDDLWAWLSEAQQLLVTKNKDPPPLDLTTVDALIRDHQDFHEDLINKNEEIEEIVRDVQSTPLSKSQIQTLQNKWRSVWRLSVERKKMLQETLDHLLEMESLNNFNFDEWRQRYNDWIRAKKLRVTDFFRKQDVQGYGTLTRNQFVNGMIGSKFPSNRMELNAVFDLFEDPSTGEMLYQLLIEALKSDKMGSRSAKIGNPSKRVDDEVVTQISRCQCRKQFAAYKMSEGKYQFGEKGRTYLLRFVNGAVMVRVGGGWVSLTEFLQSNDPCRAKNRTNMEIYKTLQDGRKSTSSLNKSASGSATSLNLSNQQTPKRSRTPQTTNLMRKKNAPLNHSMTSLISLKSKDSDQQNVNKSADSLKSPKPGQRSSFVPPKRMSTPKAEQPSASRDIKRPINAIRPPSQR